jgi:hypothetical protein
MLCKALEVAVVSRATLTDPSIHQALRGILTVTSNHWWPQPGTRAQEAPLVPGHVRSPWAGIDACRSQRAVSRAKTSGLGQH